MFEVNQARWERVARVALGVAILAVGWSGLVQGGVATAFQIIGFIPLLTGAFGWCPLYAVFGISSRGGMHRTRTA